MRSKHHTKYSIYIGNIYLYIPISVFRGVTTSLKLSPNLRMMVKPPKKQLYLDQNTLQIGKLEKLLSLVRELPEGSTAVPDAATTVRS